MVILIPPWSNKIDKSESGFLNWLTNIIVGDTVLWVNLEKHKLGPILFTEASVHCIWQHMNDGGIETFRS